MWLPPFIALAPASRPLPRSHSQIPSRPSVPELRFSKTLTALLFKIRIGPPLQIVAAFEGAYYSPDTSLISITGASADTADSGDNGTCSSPPPADNACFTVAQMSTLNKTFDKTSLCVFWDVCIEWGSGMAMVIAVLPTADYRIKKTQLTLTVAESEQL